jgi:hypothetical protein
MLQLVLASPLGKKWEAGAAYTLDPKSQRSVANMAPFAICSS